MSTRSKTMCSAAVTSAQPSSLGTKGSDCPNGHQIGAKPVVAEWCIQPVSGTSTSDPYSSQCTVSAAQDSALRSGCSGAGLGCVSAQRMRRRAAKKIVTPSVLCMEKSQALVASSSLVSSGASLARMPSGIAATMPRAMIQCSVLVTVP